MKVNYYVKFLFVAVLIASLFTVVSPALADSGATSPDCHYVLSKNSVTLQITARPATRFEYYACRVSGKVKVEVLSPYAWQRLIERLKAQAEKDAQDYRHSPDNPFRYVP